MASLKANPQLGSTSVCVFPPPRGGTSLRRRGRNAAGPPGSPPRGRCPRGQCPEAAGPAGSLRGRNVPQAALPPPRGEAWGTPLGAGGGGASSGCFGRSPVIKGCPAGKDPPAPQLFPLTAG